MNWLNRKMTASLLISLLMIPTSASAQLWQTNLKANDLAPFEGVLVPYETFKKQSDLNLEYDLQKEELRNCLTNEPNSDPRGFEFYGYVITFTAGVAAGVGGILFLRQALK